MKKQDVIDYFGGIKEAAKALDMWPQTIYQWPETVPKSAQYRVQVVTDGAFKVGEEKE